MGNLAGITDSNWNAEDESKKGFDLLPAGDYVAVITSSEVKTTNDGEGRYVSLTWQIVEGAFANRKLWENLNLWNKSAEAVAIARGTLACIQKACRIPKLGDTSELHNIPVVITVGVRRDKKSNEERNQIKKYTAKGANMAPVANAGGKASNPLI